MQQQIDKNHLQSSAYPQQSHPPHSSPCHDILSRAISVDPQITIRTINKETDVHEIKKLNIEFFPLRYEDYYYNRIINGEVVGFVAEVSVKIVGTQLAQILKKEQQKQMKERELDKNNKRKLSYRQNTYYSSQKLETNSAQPIQCNILIGSLLFSGKDSEGYLQYPWWKKIFIPQNNSIYISTLGVIEEFRHKKVGQKLLEKVLEMTTYNTYIQFIYLHVISYNTAARKLYQKMGFEVLDKLNNFYHVDKKSYEGIALGRFFNGGKKSVTWGEWIKHWWN